MRDKEIQRKISRLLNPKNVLSKLKLICVKNQLHDVIKYLKK